MLVINGFAGPSATPSLFASMKSESCWVWILPFLRVLWRAMSLSPMESSPRGLSIFAKIVRLSALPSLLVSLSFAMYPLFACFPSDPCMSTPTKTSPYGDAQMTAGHGVILASANTCVSSSFGTVVLPARAIDENALIHEIREVIELIFMVIILEVIAILSSNHGKIRKNSVFS